MSLYANYQNQNLSLLRVHIQAFYNGIPMAGQLPQHSRLHLKMEESLLSYS